MEEALQIINNMIDTYEADGIRSKEDFKKISENKVGYDGEQKGYVCLEMQIDPTALDNNVNYLRDLLEKEKNNITSAGLHPKCVVADLLEKSLETGEFEDTNLKSLMFILELHDGDYEELSHPLSEAEEMGMRNAKLPSELYREERKEEEIKKRTGYYH